MCAVGEVTVVHEVVGNLAEAFQIVRATHDIGVVGSAAAVHLESGVVGVAHNGSKLATVDFDATAKTILAPHRLPGFFINLGVGKIEQAVRSRFQSLVESEMGFPTNVAMLACAGNFVTRFSGKYELELRLPEFLHAFSQCDCFQCAHIAIFNLRIVGIQHIIATRRK